MLREKRLSYLPWEPNCAYNGNGRQKPRWSRGLQKARRFGISRVRISWLNRSYSVLRFRKAFVRFGANTGLWSFDSFSSHLMYFSVIWEEWEKGASWGFVVKEAAVAVPRTAHSPSDVRGGSHGISRPLALHVRIACSLTARTSPVLSPLSSTQSSQHRAHGVVHPGVDLLTEYCLFSAVLTIWESGC